MCFYHQALIFFSFLLSYDYDKAICYYLVNLKLLNYKNFNHNLYLFVIFRCSTKLQFLDTLLYGEIL